MKSSAKISLAYVFQVVAVLVLFGSPAFSTNTRSSKDLQYEASTVGKFVLDLMPPATVFSGKNIKHFNPVSLYLTTSFRRSGELKNVSAISGSGFARSVSFSIQLLQAFNKWIITNTKQYVK